MTCRSVVGARVVSVSVLKASIWAVWVDVLVQRRSFEMGRDREERELVEVCMVVVITRTRTGERGHEKWPGRGVK